MGIRVAAWIVIVDVGLKRHKGESRMRAGAHEGAAAGIPAR